MNEKYDYRVISIAKAISKLVSSIPEKKMQRARLSEQLSGMDVETVSELLNYIVQMSEDDKLAFKNVVGALIDSQFLVSALGNAKMSDIYIKLEEKGYYSVREMLVSYPMKRRKASESDSTPSLEMDALPLGTKKSLAKSNSKEVLDKLIHEQNPAVIKNILNNPRITEKDVLKMITRRPVKAEIITEVVNSRKWTEMYIIKKAIIMNPYTPTKIALNLLHFMLLQSLKEIASDTQLHYSIINTAKKIIQKKNSNEK